MNDNVFRLFSNLQSVILTDKIDLENLISAYDQNESQELSFVEFQKLLDDLYYDKINPKNNEQSEYNENMKEILKKYRINL